MSNAKAVYAVASELICTSTLQAILASGTRKKPWVMETVIRAATILADVAEERKVRCNMQVAIAHYSTDISSVIFDLDDASLRVRAGNAIDVAALFEQQFADGSAKKPESPTAKADQAKTESQGASSETDSADKPIEQCGLPTAIVEVLMAAGLTTGKAVIEADKAGKVVGLRGVQEPTRDRIIGLIKTALTAS